MILDLQPGEENPYSGDPAETGEELTVGDANGEQDENGAYHGSVTLLNLVGNPIIQVTTDEGESADGPLQPLQDGLDQLCEGSEDQLCLSVLEMHSDTTDSGSDNSLTTLGVDVGAPDEEGARPLSVHAVESNGNIGDDGTCQTAHGDSSVADANVGPLTVDALQGSSTSTACNGGSQSVENDSTFLNIGGNDIPFPEGCGEETNASFVELAPLLALVCAADDTNGGQTSAPYGVREALALFALISGETAVVKVAGGAAESHAVSPDTFNPPPPGGGTTDTGGGTQGAGGKGGGAGGQGAGGDDGDGGAGAGAGGGGAAGDAAAGDGSLAFTGADLLVLGLVGGALILGGLALTTMAGRRHRQTV